MKEVSRAPIHFIKCDVEGHELKALKGMNSLLREFHPKLSIEITVSGNERKEIFKLLLENNYDHFQKIEKNYPMINSNEEIPKIHIFIFMQLVRWLPKFLYRHKMDFICKFGWQDCVIPVRYNSNARTVIDLRDPEPRNVFIQKQFEPDFFDLANSFIGEKGTFFDLGANVGFCSFGLIPAHQRTAFHLFEANPNLIPLLKAIG